MGINSGKFTPPSFGSAPAWCQYEHESTKIVALTHKVSPFTAIRSGFGPVVGLWRDYLLYLLMGTNRLKMVAPSLETSIRGSVYPLLTLGSAIRPLYLLMTIKSAKVCASPKIFFRAGRRLPGSGRVTRRALKSPNAHRVGKNDRMSPKNLSSGRAVGP